MFDGSCSSQGWHKLFSLGAITFSQTGNFDLLIIVTLSSLLPYILKCALTQTVRYIPFECIFTNIFPVNFHCVNFGISFTRLVSYFAIYYTCIAIDNVLKRPAILKKTFWWSVSLVPGWDRLPSFFYPYTALPVGRNTPHRSVGF